MAREGLDLVPIVDDEGALAGVITERALARRYIRESREASSLVDAPTAVSAIVDALERRARRGGEDRRVAGRVWVYAHGGRLGRRAASAAATSSSSATATDAQRRVDRGRASTLLVTSNGIAPSEAILALAARARHRRRRVAAGQLRHRPHDHAGGAVPRAHGRRAADRPPRRPASRTSPSSSRTSTTARPSPSTAPGARSGSSPAPTSCARARAGSSSSTTPSRPRASPGVDEAEIVEILDHHHIGSIETRVPVRATFDPVGSTATLVVERFRQNGMEPSRSTAMLLLGAVLSDTVILNSPTTTERDRAVVEYLERVLGVDACRLRPRDVRARRPTSPTCRPRRSSTRDAKDYAGRRRRRCASRRSRRWARRCSSAATSCSRPWRPRASAAATSLYALMVTDILSKATRLLVGRGPGPGRARVRRVRPTTACSSSPGVMSRKKQVAPKLMAAA